MDASRDFTGGWTIYMKPLDRIRVAEVHTEPRLQPFLCVVKLFGMFPLSRFTSADNAAV